MTTATANTVDRKATMRDKRAQGIAAMGLVNREGDRFRVTTPSLRGKRTSYEVWRDEAGKVRCSCLEFEEMSAEDAQYRCEHILAVKHSLLAKSSEAVTKQPQPQPKPVARAASDNKGALPDTETKTASETRIELQPIEAATSTHVEREQGERAGTNANVGTSARVSSLSSLAAYTNEEEQTEMSKRQANAQQQEDDLDFVTAEEHEAQATGIAPVVPMQFTNTLRVLRQPIDPKLIKTREGWRDRNGAHLVEYVEWHTVADILDRVAPTWSHSVRSIVQVNDMVAVTAAITVDGVTREGVGTGTADNETGIKKAEHDALKRAAIKFGIARELYQRESEVIESQGAGPQPGEFPRDPLAKSMSDLVTPKQLGMIRALAREAQVDADEECRQTMRVTTEELSKKAASSFIDHLKGLQGAQAQPMRRAS
jgi:hypothetical protein